MLAIKAPIARQFAFNAGVRHESSLRKTGLLSRPLFVPCATPSDDSSDATDAPTPLVAIAAIAIPFELLTFYSEYTVVTTGEGLQGDVLGGLEGIGYLLVLAMVALSIKSKVSTGSGLPAGPGGVVGASEGLSFLAALGFAAFFFHH